MIKKLISHIVRYLVADSQTVRVEEDSVDNALSYKVYVAQDDIRRVIGKEGRIIKAIRALAIIVDDKKHDSISIDVAH